MNKKILQKWNVTQMKYYSKDRLVCIIVYRLLICVFCRMIVRTEKTDFVIDSLFDWKPV